MYPMFSAYHLDFVRCNGSINSLCIIAWHRCGNLLWCLQEYNSIILRTCLDAMNEKLSKNPEIKVIIAHLIKKDQMILRKINFLALFYN